MVAAVTECLLNQSQLEYNNPTCNEPGSMIFKEKNQTSINPNSNDYYTICPECKSDILVHNSANEVYVCQTCGCIILGGSFENDDKSDGFSVYDHGLKTKIPFVDSIEYKGNVQAAAADYQKAAEHTFHNQHRGNSKTVFTSTKLSKTQSKVNDICSSLYLSNKVRQKVAVAYQNFEDKHSLKGRSATSVAAAVVYLVCKGLSIPYSLKEIMDSVNIEGKNKIRYLKLAYKYARLMIFQNIVEGSLTISKENTLGLSEVMAKEGKTNAADLYLLKPSQVLRIHGKGKKQIIGRLHGRSGKELCAVGVILDYFGVNWYGSNSGEIPSHPEWGNNPYSIVSKLYEHEPAVKKMEEYGSRKLVCDFCAQTNKDLSQLIYHLNDDHQMNYLQIAGHLEDREL
jgi:transcription initiation factor TFIIIB Brf1 subunit/transcription initiation factor TFIIB